MCIYLAKMAMHDEYLSQRKPSLVAVSAIYVALKICEQLKKKEFINKTIVQRLVSTSKLNERDILATSQKILYLAQNFEREFSGLDNLKTNHFKLITKLL